MPRVYKREPLKDKLLRQRVITESGCWEWTGKKTRGGYGQLMDGRKNLRAHRAAYMVFVGEIPDGLFVCHSCDNVRCINPDHLWLGTNADNMADCAKKGRTMIGEKQPSSKLSTEKVRAIRGGLGIYEAAKMFGVSPVTAWKAKAGLTWKHVDA